MLCALPGPVRATATTASGVAALPAGASRDPASRDWIALSGSDGILLGTPRGGRVRRIVVHAPGAEGGRLLLREADGGEGARSLLLAAPDDLAGRVRRATLYLEPGPSALQLWELRDGAWVDRPPVPLSLDLDGAGHAQELVAYTTRGLGPCWLLPQGQAPPAPHAGPAPGGRVRSGLLPIAAAVLLLGAGWALSRLVYALEPRWR
jgi:hypothetical protein